MLRANFGLLLGGACLVVVTGSSGGAGAQANVTLVVDGADPNPANRVRNLSGIRPYDHVCVINGGVINVTPYNNSGNKVTTGNLELRAGSIYVDATSRINARGAGYATPLCSDGNGPNATAGGRGGCSVFDSGGGGAHFGAGGRGTVDLQSNGMGGFLFYDPVSFEDDCNHDYNPTTRNCAQQGVVCGTVVSPCPDSRGGRFCRLGPSVAGQALWHNIYDPEFGAAGGDRGCKDDGNPHAVDEPVTGGAGGGRVVLAGLPHLGTTNTSPCGVNLLRGQVRFDGTLDAGGRRGCGFGNDSAGGGAGGTVLVVGGLVTVGSTSRMSVAGGLGGDTGSNNPISDPFGDCAPGTQNGGTCDDCGGGGGGGIISVLSITSNIAPTAQFDVSGAIGGTCEICRGEAGGGAGELQIDGAYIGEYCDGFDNDFDGLVDEGLGTSTCGLGACAAPINNCSSGSPPQCSPTTTASSCFAPLNDTRPRIAVILDTSASMLLDLNGRPTFGDGTSDQPSRTGAQQSRMQLARDSLAQVISAYPEIDFSLARYHQDQGLDRSCQSAAWFECQGLVATYDNPSNNTGPFACQNLPVSGPLPSGTANISIRVDPNGDECINYAGSCGAPRRGADILTGFGMDTNHIVRWLDGRESADDVDLAVTTLGNYCDHANGGDCEVRATGPTPLAGSLLAVQDYILPVRATDPVRVTNVCRSYSVILVTDGAESCNGNPVAAAAQLAAQSPSIRTYVIAVSVLASEQAQLNQIAAAGGTTSATFVNNPADLVPALTSIIADSIRSELCNGLDDDCDGEIDEDFPGLGQVCTNGLLGVCERPGTVQCTTTTTAACVTPTAPAPTPEICNNDAACVTLCNGLDDDCDGVVDEGLQRQCDFGCGPDNEVCVGGAWVGCAAQSPEDEICNGFDDDCDGEIDEDENGDPITRPCATACGPGVETCIDGMFPTTGPGSCTAPTGSMELCNNIDDNCNGVIDDGNPGGGARCIPRGSDSYDVVDPNDLPDGVCTPGTVTCIGGALRCLGASSTSPEICNCIDDDCDGEIDEEASGTLCPGQSQCISTPGSGSSPAVCFCASPCQDSEFGACPPGRICDTTYADGTIPGLCLRGMCTGVVCPDTSVCDPATGQCQDLCAGVDCGTGRRCVRGSCIEDNCYGLGCQAGEVCEGECLPEPCRSVQCETGEFCRRSPSQPGVGECVGACPACAAGEVCIDGACVESPCGGACPTGQVCVDGTCALNLCFPACGTSRVCHGGTCVHDPCSTLDTCPEGTQCVAVDRAGTLRGECAQASSGGPGNGDAAKNVLAAGGGGCACTVAGAQPTRSGDGLMWFSVAVLFTWWLRRRVVTAGQFRIGHVLRAGVLGGAVVVAGGCKVDPFCVENCEQPSAGTSGGVGGSAGTAGAAGTGGDSGASGAAGSGPDGGVDGCVSTPEECNGRDDDCDGEIDEGFVLISDPANCGQCGRQCVLPNAFAGCASGECTIQSCEAGYHHRNSSIVDGCEYECTESGADICDGRDNDCDLAVDEETDKLTDIANCGACGNVCSYANAVGRCRLGVCEMGACVDGFANLNSSDADGCEVRCEAVPEVCNGLDDDCDGAVDEDTTPPTLCRAIPNTPCAGMTATCRAGDQGTTWYCDYPSTVDFNPAQRNGIAANELRCDGIDNDCDGRIDESFGDVGAPCNDGLRGICRGTGTVQCTSTIATGCVITNPGLPPQGAEVCNGLDDDCDGNVDEGDIDDRVRVQRNSLDFFMYRYEASRTDASADSQGIATARPCSKPGVLPWTKVSRDAAQAACLSIGMRLCTANEWSAACAGSPARVYPYGATYDDDRCNGADYGTANGAQRLVPTGAMTGCESQDGIRDLSGNAKEWTSQNVSGNYVVRGGSYASPEFGLTCATDLSRATGGTLLDSIGFRCCQNAN